MCVLQPGGRLWANQLGLWFSKHISRGQLRAGASLTIAQAVWATWGSCPHGLRVPMGFMSPGAVLFCHLRWTPRVGEGRSGRCFWRAEGVWNGSRLENVCSRWFLKGFDIQSSPSWLFKMFLISARWWLVKTVLCVWILWKQKENLCKRGFEIFRILAFKIFVKLLFLLFFFF